MTISVNGKKGKSGAPMAKKRRRLKSTRKQSGLASLMIVVAMVVVCIVMADKVLSLWAQSKELSREEALLERQIEEAKLEHENLVARQQYMQTKQYIEDVAKDKLGLVYPNEIVIKPRE